MRTTRALALASEAGLALAAATVAHAQETSPRRPPSIEVRAPAGTPILAKPRRFIAVPVAVQNTSDGELRGVLRAYRVTERKSPTPAQSVFFEVPVSLPRGGKKVYDGLVYYCQDQEPEDKLCVALEPESRSGIPAARVWPELKLERSAVLVLSLTSAELDPGSLFHNARLAGPREALPVIEKKADLAALPDRPEGLDVWDAIVECDVDPALLKGAKRKALLDWVRLGGQLIVSFSGKAAEPLDPAVMPVKAATSGDAIVQSDLARLADLAPELGRPDEGQASVRRVELLPDSELLLGTREEPLIARRRLGAGHVTYVAFPLSAPPIDRWSREGRAMLVRALLSPPREDLGPSDPSLDELVRGVAEAIREAEPPSALLVGPLLILYVLLVAPLNYLILARLGRRELSFASAGVVALVFVVAFYLIGWVYKGSQALATRGALIEVPARPAEPSRVESVTGFFSTDQGIVEATSPGGAIAPIVGKGRAHDARVIPGESGASLRDVHLDMWTLRAFRSTRLEELGSLESSLRLDQASGGRVVTGEVKNSTRTNLRQVTLYTASGAIDLGDLAIGETRKVARAPAADDAATLSLPRAFLAGLNQRGFRDWTNDEATIALTTVGGFYRGGQRATEPAARIRAQLQRRLAAVPSGRDALPALVAGISDDDPGGVDLASGSKREVNRSLVLSEASIAFAGGASAERAVLRALPGRVTGQVGWSPRERTLTQGPSQGNAVNPGYVELEWCLPASPDRPVTAEHLTLKFLIRRGPDEKYAVSFWDFKAAREGGRGRWAALRQESEGDLRELERECDVTRPNEKRPEDPPRPENLARFIDPTTGRVRVRVEQNGTNEIQLVRLVLDASVVR